MRENGPLLSRVVDPPGTKGGPRAGDFPGPPKNTFCNGWSHDPGQKVLLSRVVDAPGTKGGAFCPGSWLHPGQKVFLGGPGKFPARGPPLVPGGYTTRDKRGPFSLVSRLILCLFLFLFYFSFKIGFHLLIQLIKL